MKISKLSSITFMAALFTACNTPSTNDLLNLHTAQIDSIRRVDENFHGWNNNKEDKTSSYTWFTLGEDYHQIVNQLFYISNIETTFKENGYQITGLIGNTCSMEITNVIVQCAIKDSTVISKVVSGTTAISTIYPGSKVSFSIFIPTTKTNFKEVGVWINEYRM